MPVRKAIRAKLIANPGSGKIHGNQFLIEQVTRSLMEEGIEVDIALAKPKKMAVVIAEKAVKDGYQLVIAMGGDDTIEAVIRGIAGSKTQLGIIPAGTANNLALSLAIPEDPLEACKLIAGGRAIKLDLGQLKINKKNFYFFEVVTIGLAAAVYPHVKEIPKGNLASIKDAAMTIINHETKPEISMELDGESKITVESMLMTVTNTPYIGLKFLIAPDASLQDGLLDIAVYPGFSKAELFAYFGKVMNGGRTEDGKIQRYRANKVRVTTSPELEVLADGIMLGKGALKVKVRRGGLRIIVPEEAEDLASYMKKASQRLPAPVSPVLS